MASIESVFVFSPVIAAFCCETNYEPFSCVFLAQVTCGPARVSARKRWLVASDGPRHGPARNNAWAITWAGWTWVIVAPTLYNVFIIKMKIHSSCEIEDFVETHICKLCVILRSRVLRVVCLYHFFFTWYLSTDFY